MKRSILYLFILCNLFLTEGQTQSWIKVYGQDQNAVGRYVIEDYDNGFDIIGMKGNYKYCWIFKTDINGNILWEKCLGDGSTYLGAGNIEKTNDGGFILCGSTTLYNSSWDAIVMKLNQCAEIEWCRVLITPWNYDMGLKVKPTPEGDYVLLGGYFITNPESNISLFKFSATGDLNWHQFYPMENYYNDDQPKDLLISNDGYLVSSGRYCPDSGTSSPAPARHYFVKSDTAGNKIWDLVYGVNIHYYGWPWEMTENYAGNIFDAGDHFYSNGTRAAAFVKVLHDGTQSYNRDLTPPMQGGGLGSIEVLEDSLLVMVGGWSNNDTSHYVFLKSDTIGNLRKVKEIFHTTNGYESATKALNDKFLAIGNDATGGTWKIYAVKVNSDLEYDSIYTIPFTYDSLCPYSIVSDTVNPDCDNVYVGVEEPFDNPQTTQLHVFPNPATKNLSVEFPKYLVVTNTAGKIPSTTVYHKWKSTILEAYDISGVKVFEKEIIRAESSIEMDVSTWPRGMYYFRLVYSEHTVAGQKVVVD